MKTYNTAKRKSDKQKIENGYFEQKIKCCQNCLYSNQMSIEDELTCAHLRHLSYNVDTVDNLGLCNLFEPATQ